MLSLLLCFEVETSQTSKVLLAYCFVHSSTSSNPLSVVVSSVGPPVRLGLDITQDHVLKGNRQTRHLEERNRERS